MTTTHPAGTVAEGAHPSILEVAREQVFERFWRSSDQGGGTAAWAWRSPAASPAAIAVISAC